MKNKPEHILQKELDELKSLVSDFLEEMMYVPLESKDCDPEVVNELWEKLANAVKEKK